MPVNDQWIFRISELGITTWFLVCAAVAWRARRDDNGRSLAILVSAAVYAWIFEDLNVRGISGRGSYHYNPNFWLYLDHVPLMIVLSWAIILWTAMRISSRLAVGLQARVCADAALAVLLDLAFDVTAVRHEFWTWHGVQLDEAWFGVPAGNFFGWLYVSLAFAYGTRALEREVAKASWLHWLQLLALPPLAFVFYRGLETITNFLLLQMGWNPETAVTDRLALWVFLSTYLAVVLVSLWPGKGGITRTTSASEVQHEEVGAMGWLDHAVRASFHLFAIGGLWVLPASELLQKQRPALLAVAGLVWVLDIVYQRALGRQHRQQANVAAAPVLTSTRS